LTFRLIVSAVALLATIISIFLARANFQYAGKLAEARAVVQDKVKIAKAASAATELALFQASESEARADAAEKAAAEQAANARALRAQRKAPPAGSAVDSIAFIIASAQAETESWKSAYELQLEATAQLRAALKSVKPALEGEHKASIELQGASTKMADASKQSFWNRLVPDVGVGVAAGITPQGKPDVVAGVTLAWPL
jgi:hypothetical protein